MFALSRGFIAALGGIAITLLAWYGSWAWPGWPAGVAIDLIGRFSDFADLPRLTKSIVVVLLIMINVGTWAGLIRLAMLLLPGRKSASGVRS
jgi:hypothetical protein